MKRIIALLLVCTILLSGCSHKKTGTPYSAEPSSLEDGTVQNTLVGLTDGKENEIEIQGAINQRVEENNPDEASEQKLLFTGLNDPKLLQYIEDSVYTDIVEEFASEDYIIENVKATYVSKEYIEEVAYNSQANIFFGYTLEDLDSQFQGTKYVFTLGDNGKTTVVPFGNYDDTYEQIIKNVAVGTGVVLICVTVSVATGGAGVAPVSMIFTASAKTATSFAISGSLFGGVSAGIIEGIKTNDFDAALTAAALCGSEGFKWGAISGVLAGGVSELSAIRRATKAVEGATEYAKGSVEIPEDLPQWRQAELRALNKSGGYEQLTYQNGKRVPGGTKGATRPDVVRIVGDHIEAEEIKYFDLESPSNLSTLYSELEREVADRVIHLPAGSTQKIILDVTGRGFSEATCNSVKMNIWSRLDSIYPNIPIEIVGL